MGGCQCGQYQREGGERECEKLGGCHSPVSMAVEISKQAMISNEGISPGVVTAPLKKLRLQFNCVIVLRYQHIL